MESYRFSLIIILSQPASQSASQLAQEGLEPSWRKFRETKKKRPESRKSQFYIVKTSTYELSASKKQENLHVLMTFGQK